MRCKPSVLQLSVLLFCLGFTVTLHAASFTVLGTGMLGGDYKITAYPLQTDPSAWLGVYPCSGPAFGPGYVSSNPNGDCIYNPDINGNGPYTYTTWFNLGGLDPATTKLTGYVVADDGVAIWLNDHFVIDWVGWPVTQNYEITNWFVAGTNKLSFQLYAADNYWDYLMVGNMTVTGSQAIPEPASLILLCPGLVCLAAVRRRFKK